MQIKLILIWKFSHITFWYVLLPRTCVSRDISYLRNYRIDWHILTHKKDFDPTPLLWKDPMLLCNCLQPVYLLYYAFYARRPSQETLIRLVTRFPYSQFTTHTLGLSCVCDTLRTRNRAAVKNKPLPLCIKLCILVAGIWALNKQGLKCIIK